MQGVAGLFGSAILEVAIGLLFLYFVLSMICSGIVELLASWLKWRSRNLEFALGNLLTDTDLLKTVINDPLIRAMGQSSSDQRGQERAPSAGRQSGHIVQHVCASQLSTRAPSQLRRLVPRLLGPPERRRPGLTIGHDAKRLTEGWSR